MLIYMFLFSAIKCPLDITSGHLSSSCRGMVGEKCDVFCGDDTSMNVVQIICLSSGAWDKDPAGICRLHHESGTFTLLSFIMTWAVSSVV